MLGSQPSLGRKIILPFLTAVLSAALLVTVPVPPARASVTIRVPQDHPTIQAAIDAASSGDTIEVAPGTYSGSITVDRSVALVAAQYDQVDPRNNTTILDGGREPVVVIPKGVVPGPSITGFVIRNGKDGVRSQSPTIVEDTYFTGNGDAITYSTGGGGLASGNVFVGGRDDAIDINHPVRDITIEDNEILQTGGDGIEIRLTDDVIADTVQITIRDNRIVGSHTDGVQLIDYFEDTNRLFVIERNLIRGNGKAGIGLLDNGDSGEDFRAASIRERIHVLHNTFVGNDHGISGGDNLIALNNIFQGHVLAMKNVDGDSIASYNLFWDNATDFQGSSIDPGTTLFADPLLDANDHLGVASPAIDAGTAHFEWLGEVVMDQQPSTYVGPAPDIGWLERGSPTNQPPVIDTVTVSPAAPTTTDELTVAVVATDPDGDALTFTYQWQKNGQNLSGATSPALDLGPVGNGDRGDALSVRLIASDGSASSGAVTSGSVTVVNATPAFDQDLGDRFSVEMETVSVVSPASDADGDAVTYEATGLPPGLSIDGGTGLISGTVAAGAEAGSPYNVVLTVRDGSGAEATDALNWSVAMAEAPSISGFDPALGAPGVSVSISGSGFTSSSDVRFNGTSAIFSIASDTQVTATVPSGAATGPISVTGPGGTGTSGASFTVTAPATVTVKDYSFKPANLNVGQGQVAKWMFQGPSAHTATDSIGLGIGAAPLFDSGSRIAGEVYPFVFKAAGNYPYSSTLSEPFPMTGTIKVPVLASPSSGMTDTNFTITWSSSTLPGFRFSVQYRFRPEGSSTWNKWTSFGSIQTAPAATFTPGQGAGTYQFRSRLQNEATSRTSQFSTSASITVT